MSEEQKSNKTSILLIEDEEKIARFIELELTFEGYEVEKAFSGRDGLDKALARSFDLILLDIMLPGLNGLEVLRRLRMHTDVPVIMLTARDEVMDKVTGLDAGANDYITKPFAIEELLARIRAHLRLKEDDSNEGQASVYRIGSLWLDAESRECGVDKDYIDLTKREFDLLHCLMANIGRVMSREQLLEQVWDFSFDGGTNTVDVYIRYLRAKIEEPYQMKIIRTVRGVGYMIKQHE